MACEDSAPVRRGAIAVVIRDGRFLVIRRSRSVIAPGTYCFPGGGIEPGETEQTAIQREMMEELAAAVRPRRRLWQSLTPWNVALAWWLVDLDGNAVLNPNPQEVESLHWLTLDQLRKLPDLLPTNHDFLDALVQGKTDGPAPDIHRPRPPPENPKTYR